MAGRGLWPVLLRVLLCLLLVLSAGLSGLARAEGRAGSEAAPGIGWVDLRDIQMHMQGGAMSPAQPADEHEAQAW